MTRKRTFNYYSDPGHGWAKVPMKLIWELNLHNQISSCSYIKGSHAYLEEDSDLSLLEAELNTKRIPYTYKTFNSNKQSKIRNYVPYFWAPAGDRFLAHLKWYSSCGEAWSFVTIKHKQDKSILLRGDRGNFYQLKDVQSIIKIDNKLYELKNKEAIVATHQFQKLDKHLPFDLETLFTLGYYDVIEIWNSNDTMNFGYVVKIALQEWSPSAYRMLYLDKEIFNDSFEEVIHAKSTT